MAWWFSGFGWGKGRGWGRGWIGPWPGKGPFSYLPPWQRPGWIFGRGACRWLYPWLGYYWYPPMYTYPYYTPYTVPYVYQPYYWFRPWWGWW